MAIQFTKKEDGSIRYRVRYTTRSPLIRSLRVQRQEKGILTGLTDEEAERRLKSIEAKLRREAEREMIHREESGSTWKGVVDRWEIALKAGTGSLSVIRQGTADHYLQSIRDFTGKWMSKSAADITAADVLEILADMKKRGYSDCRLYNVKVAINQCFKWGIMKRLIRGIPHSPGIGISVTRKDSKRPEGMNHSQIATLLEKAYEVAHSWRQIWRFVLLTGTRSGEAYELRVKDIDREEKRIFLERKFAFDTKEVEPLKDKEWRQVPINQELDDLLVELGVHQKGSEEYVLPRIRAWTNGEAARVLRAFCEEAGVPSICFHTLRALWATQLLRGGVPQRVVMEMGGWADPETMDRYIRRAGIEIQGATDSLRYKRERPARILSLVETG